MFHKAAADAGTSFVLVDHDLPDPCDRAVGEEGQVAVGEQVTDDVWLGRFCDEQERVWRDDQTRPGGVECGSFRGERGGEVPGEGPDTVGVAGAGRTDQLLSLRHPFSLPASSV